MLSKSSVFESSGGAFLLRVSLYRGDQGTSHKLLYLDFLNSKYLLTTIPTWEAIKRGGVGWYSKNDCFDLFSLVMCLFNVPWPTLNRKGFLIFSMWKKKKCYFTLALIHKSLNVCPHLIPNPWKTITLFSISMILLYFKNVM